MMCPEKKPQKYYPKLAIFVASFITGLFSGFYMLFRNEKLLAKKFKAYLLLIFGMLISVLLTVATIYGFIKGWHLHMSIITLILSGLLAGYFDFFQKQEILELDNIRQASWYASILITLAYIVILIVLIIVAIVIVAKYRYYNLL